MCCAFVLSTVDSSIHPCCGCLSSSSWLSFTSSSSDASHFPLIEALGWGFALLLLRCRSSQWTVRLGILSGESWRVLPRCCRRTLFTPGRIHRSLYQSPASKEGTGKAKCRGNHLYPTNDDTQLCPP